ncbi:hypothetical protein SAMN04488700_1168 [Carnobacterium iners]|uniref:Uncharacterized protein n=1 Tax=Carnobacterium iners TaxID=1073423 RepID=A0A1X7N1R9_9LACT|nr:hypothetical protein [Carnobacterium iners]SEK20825.1 hypothetical protein SAMN04488114_101154 [Carnobacterium iners]SMH30343.1 hypothetical protein SAMN04488700_1168 [Carnobacterium iners]
MFIIINYVNSIFEQLPQTPEMVKLKQKMLSDMEKRYAQLITENQNQQQATASVLAEFGDVDNYFTKINLSTEESEVDKTTLSWSKAEVEMFKAHRSRFSLAVASGVSLILFSPVFSLLIQETAPFLPFFSSLESTQLILFSLVPVLLLNAIAISLFVAFGMKEREFNLEGKLISVDSLTQSELAQEKTEYQSQFTRGITMGILFCIVGVVFLLVSLLFINSNPFWPLIFLLSFVSIGVFLFVFFGIIYATYNKLLSVGNYTPKKIASERLTTNVANVVFPLAAGIYVISGLLFQTWSPGWMIFPILGIGFGLFATIAENTSLFCPKKPKK